MNKIILTIDTEGPRGTDPILYQIWGMLESGERYGIPKIIEICDKYDIKGLFFVDVAEIFDCGREKIEEVIKYIIEKGHDVGMHIHPHHFPDEKRHFLFDYTKEEQYLIIKQCTDSFVKMAGFKPKSFRAGKYGANQDTLDIICELGYEYDFSEFYSNKWCGIDPEICYVLPQKYKSLIEFPVTIYRSIKIGSIYERYDKLEVTENTQELTKIIKEYSRKDNDGVITLFMHSFSFLDYLDHPDNPVLNKRNLCRFETLLKNLTSDKSLSFISEKHLSEIKTCRIDSLNNIEQTSGLMMQFRYTICRAYDIRKTNLKARYFFLSLEIVLAICVMIIALLIIQIII